MTATMKAVVLAPRQVDLSDAARRLASKNAR
jgi:hypothetical protein